jgi:hypothetical protein
VLWEKIAMPTALIQLSIGSIVAIEVMLHKRLAQEKASFFEKRKTKTKVNKKIRKLSNQSGFRFLSGRMKIFELIMISGAF